MQRGVAESGVEEKEVQKKWPTKSAVGKAFWMEGGDDVSGIPVDAVVEIQTSAENKERWEEVRKMRRDQTVTSPPFALSKFEQRKTQ